MEIKKKENFFQVKTKSIQVDKDEAWNIESIVLEWYASTKNKDRVNDIVLPSAFEKALDVYMKNPRVFLQHDPNKNIGKTIEATINSKGLYVKTKILLNISLDGTDWIRLFDAIEKDLYKTFSIGYKINSVEEKEVKENWIVIWYERIIKDLDLVEISLVSVPANHYAMIKSISECLPENTKLLDDQIENQLKGMTGDIEAINWKEMLSSESIEKKLKKAVMNKLWIKEWAYWEYVFICDIFEKEFVYTRYNINNDGGTWASKYYRIDYKIKWDVVELWNPTEVEAVSSRVDKTKYMVEIIKKEIETIENTPKETNRPENTKKNEDKPVIEKEIEEEIKENIKNVEEAENSVEITEGEDETIQTAEETKNIELKTKGIEVETKSFVDVKAFESRIEELVNYQSKEVGDLRSDVKEIEDGLLEIIKQFKSLQEYTKNLENTMSKVVVKAGYTYETLPKQSLSKFWQAIMQTKWI